MARGDIQIGCYRNYSCGGDIHKMSSRFRQFGSVRKATNTRAAVKDFPGLTSLWQLQHKCNYHFILNDLCATRQTHAHGKDAHMRNTGRRTCRHDNDDSGNRKRKWQQAQPPNERPDVRRLGNAVRKKVCSRSPAYKYKMPGIKIQNSGKHCHRCCCGRQVLCFAVCHLAASFKLKPPAYES